MFCCLLKVAEHAGLFTVSHKLFGGFCEQRIIYLFFILVCAIAVRNCLECQQHLQLKSTGENMKNQKAIHGLVGTAKSAAKVMSLCKAWHGTVLCVSH